MTKNHASFTKKYMQHIINTKNPESPARGLQSSPPACTASLIVGSSKAPWPWPWIRSRSYQHTQYVYMQDYQRAQPYDCSITQYWNMAIWISWNIDITWSLNSRDSFPRRKLNNRAPTSYRPSVVLSPATISIELHAKVAEEIDL